MRIDNTPEIASFLERCRSNLGNQSINEFLDQRVTPAREDSMRAKLAKAKAAEFFGPKESWPSLFLSAEEFMKSPYHQAIQLSAVKEEPFSYERMRVLPNRLFSLDSVQADPNRELNEWMKLRAMDREFETAVLCQGEKMWMIDAPSEEATNNPPAQNARGNVITFGLGIGYFIFMALRNPKVTHITAAEKSEAVIRMFETAILPQFDGRNRITLIHGDALDYWNREFLDRFDYIYADIWQSAEDGLFWMDQLLSRYHPPDDKTDFWIEDSCVVPLRTVIFLHLEELFYHCRRSVSEEYQGLMKKTRQYFRRIDHTAASSEELKYFLYERSVLRAILGEQI